MSSKKNADAQDNRSRSDRDLGQRLISAVERGDLEAIGGRDLQEALVSTVDTRPATLGLDPPHAGSGEG